MDGQPGGSFKGCRAVSGDHTKSNRELVKSAGRNPGSQGKRSSQGVTNIGARNRRREKRAVLQKGVLC